MVQPRAMQAWQERRSFRDIVEGDALITARLPIERIGEAFDPAYQIRRANELFERVGL